MFDNFYRLKSAPLVFVHILDNFFSQVISINSLVCSSFDYFSYGIPDNLINFNAAHV